MRRRKDAVSRVLIYVPERDAFIMVVDLETEPGLREWRPPGGGIETGEEGEAAAKREAWEEVHLWLFSHPFVFLDRYNNDKGRRIEMYLAIVPESEAQHMKPCGTDAPALIPRSALIADEPYKGVPFHRMYRECALGALARIDQHLAA